MKIAYTAFDRAGKSVRDVIDAASTIEAGELLRQRGLYATELSVSTDSGTDARGARARSAGGAGRRLADASMFVRQLSVLVSTGTPMVEAITSLERQLAPGAWRTSVERIRQRVEEGSSLSAALEHEPRYFDPVARSLIAAGESGGKLDDMLRRLASLMRQQIRVRSQIIGAMVYPVLLVNVALGVLCTMMFFVLPRFKGLFESLGAQLPPTTRLLMDMSEFVAAYWWALLAGVIVCGVSAKLWLSTPAGKRGVATFVVRAPQIGRVARAMATARVVRMLGVLVEGRVPVQEALRLTRESTGNVLYSELVADAEDAVTRGENISNALERSTLVSSSVVEAIRSGERSGQLGPVLTHLADFMDEDNELVLKSLSSIVEPLILIVLGCLIGFVAVSMFLPLFDLATATQGGAH